MVASWLDVWLEDHLKPNRTVKNYVFCRPMAEKRIKLYLGLAELQRVGPTDITSFFRTIEKNGLTPS